VSSSSDLTPGRFATLLVLLLTLGAGLRFVFPTADPPWQAAVGITWHDEGPWVHNARNKVLWGEWSTDRWNPMYLTPVFTGLEYVALSAFGVGQWQVRTVSQVMGLLSILAVALGVAACASRRAGIAAAALLATNYIWVMWNRAALMETTMVAFIAISWSAYALAYRRPIWGVVAGAGAILAFFTKAAAAFYVGAIALEAVFALAGSAGLTRWRRPVTDEENRQTSAAALWTLAGAAAAGTLFLVFFVVPYWQEFRFYNWQMSVTRKPTYGVHALVDRASWLPVIHDFFTRQWLITVAALAACFGLAVRWRSASGPDRLLGLWVALGMLEMIVHDVGNERRYIFLIPAFVVLAVLVLVRDGRLVPMAVAAVPARVRWVALPLVLYAAYIALGAIVRLPFLYDVRPSVRASAVAAVLVTLAAYASWKRLGPWLAGQTWTSGAALAIVGVLMAGDLAQFGQWAAGRTYKNVTASRLIGEWLPPGTLVQGKLANGLALDNRIKPIFVGRGFGNYDDRLRRTDTHYLLTYLTPWKGYEGPVITDVLDGCPGWRILRTFDVAETAGGHDRAALILKPASCQPSRSPSAKD